MRLISTLRDVAPFVDAVLLAGVAVSLSDVAIESRDVPIAAGQESLRCPVITVPLLLLLMTESGGSVECPLPLLLTLLLLAVPPNLLLSVQLLPLPWLVVAVAAKPALRAVMSCATSASHHVTKANTGSAFERSIRAMPSLVL